MEGSLQGSNTMPYAGELREGHQVAGRGGDLCIAGAYPYLLQTFGGVLCMQLNYQPAGTRSCRCGERADTRIGSASAREVASLPQPHPAPPPDIGPSFLRPSPVAVPLSARERQAVAPLEAISTSPSCRLLNLQQAIRRFHPVFSHLP